MKFIQKGFLFLLSLFMLNALVLVPSVQATRGLELLQNTGKNAGFSEANQELDKAQAQAALINTIISLIQLVLQVLGVLLLIFIIYAGFLWFSAGGNEDQVARAKKYLTNAVIGMVIISTSYLLAGFIENLLLGNALQNTPSASPGNNGGAPGTTIPQGFDQA